MILLADLVITDSFLTLLAAIGVPVVGGLMAWMFKVNSHLATIAKGMEAIPALWDKVESHGNRLNDHGERIYGLEKVVGGQQCEGT